MTIDSSVLTTTDINSGTIDNTSIGASTPSTGVFTTLTANEQLVINAGATIIGDNTSEITLNVKGVSEQTSQLFNVETNSGDDKLSVSSSGQTTITDLVATTVDINDDLQILGSLRINEITALAASYNVVRFESAIGLGQNQSIYFEGATNDDFETQLTVEDPTTDKIITLPDATGTVALTNTTGYATGSIFTSSVTLVIYNSAGVAQKTIVGSAT